MTTIIDGKKVSNIIKEGIYNEVQKLKTTPGLAVVIVGDDQASKKYVNSKVKACKKLGFFSNKIELESNVSQDHLISVLKSLAIDNSIHGILVQLPLPGHIDEKIVINNIPSTKDVDCFTNENLGKLFSHKGSDLSNLVLPCTPFGIITLLNHYNISLSGKEVAIIGRSNIVGKPLSLMLTSQDATVTLCHSRTRDLANVLKTKDIVISAIGKANFVKKEMVKKGAILIDVGINLDQNSKLVGDIDFNSVQNWASHVSPVPGGVGPMTIAMLLRNTLFLAKKVTF